MEQIQPMSPNGIFQYKLPPSKSHMIRELMLASKSSEVTEINFQGTPGEDIISMANCLEKMGVKIEKRTTKWIVYPPKKGLISPKGAIYCGNSGTVARIMTALAATFDSEITIDGDNSLRNRSNSTLSSCLKQLGCEISSRWIPMYCQGPNKSERHRN